MKNKYLISSILKSATKRLKQTCYSFMRQDHASFGNLSLNDTLVKNKTESLDITRHLMAFRERNYAIIADMSKTFLCIKIKPPRRRRVYHLTITVFCQEITTPVKKINQ